MRWSTSSGSSCSYEHVATPTFTIESLSLFLFSLSSFFCFMMSNTTTHVGTKRKVGRRMKRLRTLAGNNNSTSSAMMMMTQMMILWMILEGRGDSNAMKRLLRMAVTRKRDTAGIGTALAVSSNTSKQMQLRLVSSRPLPAAAAAPTQSPSPPPAVLWPLLGPSLARCGTVQWLQGRRDPCPDSHRTSASQHRDSRRERQARLYCRCVLCFPSMSAAVTLVLAMTTMPVVAATSMLRRTAAQSGEWA